MLHTFGRVGGPRVEVRACGSDQLHARQVNASAGLLSGICQLLDLHLLGLVLLPVRLGAAEHRVVGLILPHAREDVDSGLLECFALRALHRKYGLLAAHHRAAPLRAPLPGRVAAEAGRLPGGPVLGPDAGNLEAETVVFPLADLLLNRFPSGLHKVCLLQVTTVCRVEDAARAQRGDVRGRLEHVAALAACREDGLFATQLLSTRVHALVGRSSLAREYGFVVARPVSDLDAWHVCADTGPCSHLYLL
mmetsp:Transcript_5829/g.15493  ORF Transcript_5829/g.15493 Transcript_5829/m.15493 type:complete len:249 (-) Transcript_5829:494-1240(-)